MAAGILASLSPRTGPVTNTQLFTELMRRAIKNEAMNQPQWRAPATAMGDRTSAWTPPGERATGGHSPKPGAKFPGKHWQKNVGLVMEGRGDELRLDKVNDMRSAALGREDAFVGDRQYAKLMEDPARGIFTDVEPNRITGSMDTGKVEMYPLIENAVRTAAARASKSVSEFSAQVWEGIRQTIRQTGQLYGQPHRAWSVPSTTTGFNEVFTRLVKDKATHLGITPEALIAKIKAGDAELLGVLVSAGVGAMGAQSLRDVDASTKTRSDRR
jgi:hypothetical protein